MSLPSKTEKRKTPVSATMAWVGELLVLCSPGTDMANKENERQFKLLVNELSFNYLPSALSSENLAPVATKISGIGVPTYAKVSWAIDKVQEAKPARDKPSLIELSDDRRKDPRITIMSPSDQSWVSYWDRRIVELKGPRSDVLWDDIKTRHLSKRANLASCVRQYSPKAWEVIANPFHLQREIDEAAWVRSYYGDKPPVTHQAADGYSDDEGLPF